MNFKMRRKFSEVAQEFKSNTFNVKTIYKIVELVRENKNELTDNECKELLQIPINVLLNDVELIKELEWSSKNSSYFYGNIPDKINLSSNQWKVKFSNGDYDVEDIGMFCEMIADNFAVYRSASEFMLRNIETTLRDDVKIKTYSKFKSLGEFFYRELLKIIEC